MAKFTSPANLNIRLPSGEEVVGVAGTTHRISDALVEEFVRDIAPRIPGGITWITQDETSAVAGFDPSNKYDKTGGTISGAATVTGTLAVGGAATLSSSLGVIGAATVTGAFAAIGAANFSSTMGVSGQANFGNVVASAATVGSSVHTTARFKGQPWFDVKAYGATGDGATDDTAAINTALTSAGVSGGTVHFPIGTYLTSATLSIPSGVKVVGEGPKSIIKVSHTGSGFSAIGTLGTTFNLSGDVAVGDISINAGTASSQFAAGDMIWLQDEGTALVAGHKRAEIGTVRSVTGGLVNVEGAAMDVYQTSQTAKIAKITPKTDITIRDIAVYNTIYTTGTTTSTSPLILFDFGKNIIVDNVRLYENNDAGLRFRNCINARMANCDVSDMRDDTTNGINGYGVEFSHATRDSVVSGTSFRRCRHGVSTGTSSAGPTPSYGVERGITVSGNTFAECSNFCIDTHEDIEGMTIIGNTVAGSKNGGVQIRGRQVTVSGNAVKAAKSIGVYVSSLSLDVLVTGNAIVDIALSSSSTNGYGIAVDGADRVALVGNTIKRCASHGIAQLSSATNGLSIVGNHLYNNGTVTSGDGINFAANVSLGVIMGNLCVNQVSVQQRYGIRLESAVTAASGLAIIGNILNNALSANYSNAGTATPQLWGNTGAANMPGYQQRATVSTGTLTASQVLDVTLTWPRSFTDSSYNIQAAVVESSGNIEVRAIKSIAGSAITATLKNNDAGASHVGTLHALGVHD